MTKSIDRTGVMQDLKNMTASVTDEQLYQMALNGVTHALEAYGANEAGALTLEQCDEFFEYFATFIVDQLALH